MLEIDLDVEVVPSTDKYCKNHDDYICTISQKFKDIAFKVLNEDENIRTQALDQFREWIVKDPYIIRCRTDASFLLRFLRASKFNVPTAFLRLQKYLAARQIYSGWYQNLDINDPALKNCSESGGFIPLPDRTHEGYRILIQDLKKGDLSALKCPENVIRFGELAHETLLDDEESQITGYIIITDLANITLKHAAWFGLMNIRTWLISKKNCVPARLKQIVVINIEYPQFKKFFDMMLKFFNPKMKDRVLVLNSVKELKQHFDIDIFPEEFGGTRKTKKILDDFYKKMQAKRKKILALDDMYIDLSKHLNTQWCMKDFNGSQDASFIGSFRKLEID